MTGFSMDQGVFNLLSTANEVNAPEEYTFYLLGDLYQMSAQRAKLEGCGFDIKQSNVYPVIKEKDVHSALAIIFQSRTEGWWHYKDKYVKYEICTAKEFDEMLQHYLQKR